MLEFLHLENVAVAKNVDIDFKEGFNVLTGETGAGKSIIIDSINMLLGAKINKGIIRHGEDHAVVSALFSNVSEEIYQICSEQGIPFDREDLFSITRSIYQDGKNVIKINSKTSTLMQLKQIGALLVNIHGQNDNFSFMNKANHIRLLDEYVDVQDLLEEYGAEYKTLMSIKSKVAELLELSKRKELMVSGLKFQIKEISSANLKNENEEEILIEKRNKLKSYEQILKSSTTAYKALYRSESGISASVLIEKAIEALKRIEGCDSQISDLISALRECSSEIEDVSEKVKEISSFDGVENPTKQLDMIEDRLALIHRMKTKYAPTISEILKIKDEAEQKLQEYEELDTSIDKLKVSYKNSYQNCCNIAEKIHKIRETGAKQLSDTVKNTLVFLDMPKVKFQIKVEANKKDEKFILSATGFDNVEFAIATNAGEKLASMSDIASGGELARIMLALKGAINDKNGPQVVVFDEVDTGLSGSTSQKIGYKLKKFSEFTQVLCVTHSAQIAAFATNHYLIKKQEIDGRAQTQIKLLSENESVDELARIIGGSNLTANQFIAAKELIEESKQMINTLQI